MSKKISDLPAVVAPAIADEWEVNQTGTSRRLSASQLLSNVDSGAYVFSFLGVGLGGSANINLLGDGSANFCGQGASASFDADGVLRLGGAGLSAKYSFFVDGTGFQTSEPVLVGPNITLFPSGDVASLSLSVNGGVVTLGADGNVTANDSLICQNFVIAGIGYRANGLSGVTGDYSILVSGVPQTLHFEGGILTSVT
jgi:hypothetical protein